MNLEHLNEKQRETVLQTEGVLLVLAGAGSGKTSTMTHRMAYLIEQGVPPYKILAVTFTNKAAKEMRERVEKLTPDSALMWISTFHSMCLRILRRDCEKIGYNSNFVIYDTQDQKTVIKNIIKSLDLDEKKFTPRYLAAAFSKIKDGGVQKRDITLYDSDSPAEKAVKKAYQEYAKELKKNNAMDFDDLLLNTVKLLNENSDVLEYYQRRFEYIMVDEYQDTNMVQYELIKMLAEHHGNLCVVGDDDQCIYQWRGADIRNILEFEKDFEGATVVKLEQNYRSFGNILKAAHSVVEKNKGRKSKKLWTTREDGEKIVYYRADNEKDEARYIAQQVDLLKNNSRNYSDFAVLCRTNAQTRNIEEAFTNRGIPYRMLSGLRYYDRKEIKDMMAYLRLVVNPSDDLSFKRVINEPKRGIGPKAMEIIEESAREKNISLIHALEQEDTLDMLSTKAASEGKTFSSLLLGCREERGNLRISDIYETLLKDSGYLESLVAASTVENETRIENLLEFLTVISEYEKNAENPTIDEFMENLALMSEVDNHDESQDAVVVMTIHASKGLEFPVVFLPGLEDGLFPGNRAFDSEDGLEEERRLCYVGMTRAKERLLLSSAALRTLYGRTDYTRESQFLYEIDSKYIEGDKVYKKQNRLGVDTGNYDGSFGTSSSHAPFNPIKYAQNQAKQENNNIEVDAGDRINHGKFGDGTVLEVAGKIVVVDFDNGERKKLVAKLAPISKIES